MIMRNGGHTMTETTDAGASRGFFQNLSDLYFAPREAFAGVLRVPRLPAAILGWLVLGLLFFGVWMSKVEPREFFKTQMEEGGQWQKMSAERRTAVLDAQPLLPDLRLGVRDRRSDRILAGYLLG